MQLASSWSGSGPDSAGVAMPRGLAFALTFVVLVACGAGEPRSSSAPPATGRAPRRQPGATPIVQPRVAAAAPMPRRTGQEEYFRQRIIDEFLMRLRDLTEAEPVLRAVREANERPDRALAELQELDVRWRAARDPAFFAPYLESECAVYLQSVTADHPRIPEVFVMDDVGGLVASSAKTSDYWQGDEAKWQQSFNKGKGQLFVDEIAYDESTREYVVQISLPIFDDGKTIGAMTASVICR